MSVWWNPVLLPFLHCRHLICYCICLVGSLLTIVHYSTVNACTWEQVPVQLTFLRKRERSRKKTKDVRCHVSVTDTFNILLLPGDRLVWSYLCDAHGSDKHRILGQFYRRCYGDSLQTKHTHQEILREPHLKHDKFTKLTEEECPLKQRLPAPNLFVHLQTSCEAMMSFTHPTVNENMNWNYLFISSLCFLLIISFNLTQDPAHNKGLKLIQMLTATRFFSWRKTQRKENRKKKPRSFVLVRRTLWGAYAAQ